MLSVEGLSKRYGGHDAVRDVSFSVSPGEIVGLVGASGSGKSTIARCILGLERPDAGRIRYGDAILTDRAGRRAARRAVQAVFQDPRSSLNPRWTVRRILSEPLETWIGREPRAARTMRLNALLSQVTLSPDLLARYPHELSTGQCQRLCVARAFACGPTLLVLDEPLSALDVSVQARMLVMLRDLHAAGGPSYLLITHDFAVVREICDRVLVLDGGRIVETGPVARVLDRPFHSVTRALLLDALPLPFQAAAAPCKWTVLNDPTLDDATAGAPSP
ncbi:ABC transporter ATP-binding protein [Rubrimonas cliftonensis]|uniref:Peptide/nickel transport system ATP-binding protein n=1 Tax=Rubrimonas cliftonensis TaxID=89524 RepID=A0A1H4G8U4_9RHOB|nr:dipeptide/oligopeptide/nickel ABC transporter ATP-binding protein [Rubrimonas cliftonensis]SEB05994.1 peptide/nickel transport system ATP-binding protein [Rubrimonas cliftonensis]